MVISLIHPSRQRPSQAHAAATYWMGRAGTSIDYLLSIDRGDPDDAEYSDMFDLLKELNVEYGHRLRICINKNRSAVDAINYAATFADGNIFVVMSDDFMPPENWAKTLIDNTFNKMDWIAKTPDGIQSWLITLPIMDRAYYNRFGYIYHPDYAHMFCDTELTCVADLTGRKITLDIPFTHNHYSTGRSQKDEVSIKADKTWDQGQALFIERAKRNFDLKEVTSKIMSPDYVNWMRSKGIKV